MNQWQEEWIEYHDSPDWKRWERQQAKAAKKAQRIKVKGAKPKLIETKQIAQPQPTTQISKHKPNIRSSNRQSYVYFIQARSGGPVKIGWTYSPDRRLKSLQSASPYKLVIRKLVPGTQRLEHYLHQRYEAYRLEGEWFEVQTDMPGCLHADGLSTAIWLDDEVKVKLFEQESQEAREAAQEYQRRKEQPPTRRQGTRVFDQVVADLVPVQCTSCGSNRRFQGRCADCDLQSW